MLIHVVSAGETLWQIANRYAVPVQSISQLNALATPRSTSHRTITGYPFSLYNVYGSKGRYVMVHRTKI